VIKYPSRTEALDKRKGHLLDYAPDAVNFIPASQRGRRIFSKLQTGKEKHEHTGFNFFFFYHHSLKFALPKRNNSRSSNDR